MSELDPKVQAFLQGAKWMYYKLTNATMFGFEQAEAVEEAEKRLKAGRLGVDRIEQLSSPGQQITENTPVELREVGFKPCPNCPQSRYDHTVSLAKDLIDNVKDLCGPVIVSYDAASDYTIIQFTKNIGRLVIFRIRIYKVFSLEVQTWSEEYHMIWPCPNFWDLISYLNNSSLPDRVKVILKS